MNWWPAVVAGWPAILLSLALSVVGIRRRRPVLLAAAAVIAIPFSLYLGGTPAVGWIGLVIPLILTVASASVHYRRPEIAWSLLVPVMAVVSWVAHAAISSWT